MSAVLNSPLVALTSDYASFGFLAAANNLWTWIAIIGTAALSFWRIRALASSAISSRISKKTPSSLSTSCPEHEIVNTNRSFPQPTSHGATEEAFEFGASTSSPPPSASPTWFECDGGGATKGKFMTYYKDDRTEDEPPPALAATTVDEAESGGREWWWWSWERAVRWRDGERGWYNFQDLRAINGNVVKLWDDEN